MSAAPPYWSKLVLNWKKPAKWFLHKAAARLRWPRLYVGGGVEHLRNGRLVARRLRWGSEVGMGDALCMSAVAHAFVQQTRDARVTLATGFPALFRHNPDIDLNIRLSMDRLMFDGSSAKNLEYENDLHSRRHLAQSMCEGIVPIIPKRPIISYYPEKRELDEARQMLEGLPRPIICFSTATSAYTPNKNWFPERWPLLVKRLLQECSVVQTGTAHEEVLPVEHPRFRSLIGKTDLRQLGALLAVTDVYVGPISGPLHLASAVHTPAVVIAGGYEPQEKVRLENQLWVIGTASCAPCWKKEECLSRECMQSVTVDRVFAAVREALAVASKDGKP